MSTFNANDTAERLAIRAMKEGEVEHRCRSERQARTVARYLRGDVFVRATTKGTTVKVWTR